MRRAAMPRTLRSLRRRWVASEGFSEDLVDQEAFESAAVAIHVVSPEGLIVETNRAFELMFGASRRLYLGKHTAILGSKPVAAGLRLLNEIRAGIALRGVWRGTIETERFNGRPFFSRVHVYPMRVRDRGYLVFFQEEAPTTAATGATAAWRHQEQALAAVS